MCLAPNGCRRRRRRQASLPAGCSVAHRASLFSISGPLSAMAGGHSAPARHSRQDQTLAFQQRQQPVAAQARAQAEPNKTSGGIDFKRKGRPWQHLLATIRYIKSSERKCKYYHRQALACTPSRASDTRSRLASRPADQNNNALRLECVLCQPVGY